MPQRRDGLGMQRGRASSLLAQIAVLHRTSCTSEICQMRSCRPWITKAKNGSIPTVTPFSVAALEQRRSLSILQSRAQLNQLLAEVGTNLLSAEPGTSMFGHAATIPPEAIAMIGRLPHVEAVSAIGLLADAKVHRKNRIPENQSGGMAVFVAHLDLPKPVGADIAAGSWFRRACAASVSDGLETSTSLDSCGLAVGGRTVRTVSMAAGFART